jgi:hypothetical protein
MAVTRGGAQSGPVPRKSPEKPQDPQEVRPSTDVEAPAAPRSDLRLLRLPWRVSRFEAVERLGHAKFNDWVGPPNERERRLLNGDRQLQKFKFRQDDETHPINQLIIEFEATHARDRLRRLQREELKVSLARYGIDLNQDWFDADVIEPVITELQCIRAGTAKVALSIIKPTKRGRGKPRVQSDRVEHEMREAIKTGRCTADQLAALREKELIALFRCKSRTTAREARKRVLNL